MSIPLLAAIQRILMEEWDPVGVRGVPGAADEYDSYAFEIFTMLHSQAPDEDEVAAYLLRIETAHMALAPTPHRARRAANLILAIGRSSTQ